MSEDAPILEFSAAPRPPVSSSGRRVRTHRCRSFSLNEDRTVTCRDCGALVDPFHALIEVAAQWDRRREANAWAQTQNENLRAEAEDLKREVRNLKAQARRARSSR